MQDTPMRVTAADAIALHNFVQHPVQSPDVHTPAVHPSRSAPLCKNCRHVLLDRDGSPTDQCNHPTTPISVIDGAVGVPASVMRGTYSEDARLRFGFEPCAPAGVLFEPQHLSGRGVE